MMTSILISSFILVGQSEIPEMDYNRDGFVVRGFGGYGTFFNDVDWGDGGVEAQYIWLRDDLLQNSGIGYRQIGDSYWFSGSYEFSLAVGGPGFFIFGLGGRFGLGGSDTSPADGWSFTGIYMTMGYVQMEYEEGGFYFELKPMIGIDAFYPFDDRYDVAGNFYFGVMAGIGLL